MNSPPMSNNAMVSHVIHMPLSVVPSISCSEKLQKATNKGRDWSEDATSLLLQGFGEMFLAIDKGYFKQVQNLLINSSQMRFMMFVMQN